MDTPYEDQMRVLRWLQEREIEKAGNLTRVQWQDVMSALDWTEARTKGALHILHSRGDINHLGWLTAQGHSRLNPIVSSPQSVNLIHNTGTMGPIQQGGSGNIQSSEVFQVAKEDKDFLEKSSRFFLRFLGEWGTILLGWLLSSAGGLGTALALLSDEGSEYGLLLFPGIGLLILGSLMIRAYKQRKRSRCPACGTYYALKETGATARDVRYESSSNQVERTTTRAYKCASCGHETSRVTTRSIP